MSKKIGVTLVLLILGITLYLLKIPFTSDAHVTTQKPFVTIEEVTLNKVIEKLQEKYVGVDVTITPNKELVLQVVGDVEYFNSIKKDMEAIARSVIEGSILKEYTVIFKRWDLIGHADKMIGKEIQLILQTLTYGLKDYEEIKRITTESQQRLITIHTTLKGKDKNAQKAAFEIEQKVKVLLKSNELNSLATLHSYSFKIVNIEGIEINS